MSLNTSVTMTGPVLNSVADRRLTRPAKKKGKKGKKAKAAAAATRDIVEDEDVDDEDIEKRT